MLGSSLIATFPSWKQLLIGFFTAAFLAFPSTGSAADICEGASTTVGFSTSVVEAGDTTNIQYSACALETGSELNVTVVDASTSIEIIEPVVTPLTAGSSANGYKLITMTNVGKYIAKASLKVNNEVVSSVEAQIDVKPKVIYSGTPKEPKITANLLKKASRVGSRFSVGYVFTNIGNAPGSSITGCVSSTKDVKLTARRKRSCQTTTPLGMFESKIIRFHFVLNRKAPKRFKVKLQVRSADFKPVTLVLNLRRI